MRFGRSDVEGGVFEDYPRKIWQKRRGKGRI